jgi:hypothetical protein
MHMPHDGKQLATILLPASCATVFARKSLDDAFRLPEH